ncbi:MAG: phosphoglucosamine mutase [Desulfobacterales bacterium]
MGKLFGTDGIRGRANQYPITAETALKVGRTAAFMFGSQDEKKSIVVGQDTRISSEMIAYALISGICSMGMDVQYVGVMPTPAVAFFTSAANAAAGIMISASHNPFIDNGIKIFNHRGFKLSDTTEADFEDLLLNRYDDILSALNEEMGAVSIPPNAEDHYLDFLRSVVPADFSLSGMKIVMDCSNGATYRVAPKMFERLGASVIPLFISPDGRNINADCGSQHPHHVIEKVLESGADVGLAFDGDGDRLIAVDEHGKKVSGDAILAVCAKLMKVKNRLKNSVAVTTVMSNVGLGIALQELGIRHLMTDVGDRQVVEKMIAEGSIIGGEDSGHMVFLDHHTTGDGILTALKLLEAMRHETKPLSELTLLLTVFPQVLVNVQVTGKPDLSADPDIRAAISSVEKKLGDTGRVLVRYSGTRPLCRVMVEGPSKVQIEAYAGEIVEVITKKLGIR